MVPVRSLRSAPTFNFSPACQLFHHWRSNSQSFPCPARPAPRATASWGCLFSAQDTAASRRKIWSQIPGASARNGRFCPWFTKATKKWSVWDDAAQRRVRCLGTLSSDKQLSFSFPVTLEENTTIDSTVQAAVDQLQIEGRAALELVVEDLDDLEGTDTVELSLLLCNDAFMQDLNKKWLGKDSPTDVLSFPQDQEFGLTPHLLLGDVVISLETAARQAEERGHSLLEELRILLVHGLLHVLGYDHELGPEASEEMEERESHILSKLGWKGKGLINESLGGSPGDVESLNKSPDSVLDGSAWKRSARPPPFKILFCDMDGTLLNSKSMVTKASADALRAAVARGVQVVIATGKTRYGAMLALERVNLCGDGRVVSSTLPGIFTQGLQVYGRGGSVIHSANLDPDLVREAFLYSLERDLPTLGFVENRTVTLRRSHFTDVMHSVYLEPKAEVIPSLDELLATCPVQKILFYGTNESIKQEVRPHWALKAQGRATLVQALGDMLEVLPLGQSKGAGVKMLLDHFDVSPQEVMAIGDGENDLEMLALAGWGVAMANGFAGTKAVAKALTSSNDEDGVAEAVHRYILS